VYLEATLNEYLRNLLRLTPGVICNHSGLVYQHIPLSEGLELLKMRHARDPPQVGKWVQVLRGIYKGDVGYVLSTRMSKVQLLLIPRLAPPNLSHLKRKRSTTFPAALFDYATVTQDYNIQPLQIDEDIYSFQNKRFEHGLISRSYILDSVSPPVSTIPLESFWLFHESGHPKLATSKCPKPSDWYFAEGDEVCVVNDTYPPSYKLGIISAIRNDTVDMDTGEGIVSVGWMDICKFVRIGDFVEVTGGVHKGQKGWVDEVVLTFLCQVANIIQLVDGERPVADRTKVCPIQLLDECPLHAIFSSDVHGTNEYIKACHCPCCPWTTSKAWGVDSTIGASSMEGHRNHNHQWTF
jgi:hypothetical protein